MGTIGLITRSRTTGYKTFPGTCTSWWEAREYRRLTRVEAPTLVLKARARGSIDFFLAGIASQQRTDHVGTPIRYSLFGVADTSDEIQRLTSAAEAFCDDASLSELAKWLDDTVGSAVEDWMENNLDATTEAPFLANLQSRWGERAGGGGGSNCSDPTERVMMVGRENPEARRLIRAFAAQLNLEGQGTVLFLNLAGQDEYKAFDIEPLLGLVGGTASPKVLKKKGWVLTWSGLSQEQKLGIAVGVGLLLAGLLYLILRPSTGS